MKIYIEKTDEYKEVEASTVKELLEKLKINPTTILVTKNNELVTEEEKLTNKDEIKILSVISGG
ncbi:MoaD/ThiS family protein [Candidatus Woesearchaeota archaeon]|nr:MoaD/ThiS family protein [Candidatus Woesearchaeota archaeon]